MAMETKKKQQEPIGESVTVKTPIGMLEISAADGAVCSISIVQTGEIMTDARGEIQPVLKQAMSEINEYFAGKRTEFTFPMRTEGTLFQRSVWEELKKIPYGKTKSYGEIAAAIDNPKAFRAVGMACNKNPIMIAVPCHRVLGAGGAMTGYAGGVPVKEALLNLEQKSK
jgi:methylated-DNA-[protein]-cysteine S-methyltransferase